jgi:hypothetical protein
VAHVNTI